MYVRGNNSQFQSALKWKGLGHAYLQPLCLPIRESETVAAADKIALAYNNWWLNWKRLPRILTKPCSMLHLTLNKPNINVSAEQQTDPNPQGSLIDIDVQVRPGAKKVGCTVDVLTLTLLKEPVRIVFGNL